MSVLRDLTNRQFLPFETKDYKKGGLTTFPLPESGLGARLYLKVKGTLSVALGSGTAVLSPLGVRNLISRITVRLNDGSLLYEMEGFNTKIPVMLQNGVDVDIIQVNRNYNDTSPYKSPAPGATLSTTDYDLLFTVEIPFINNDKDMLGLVLLQNGTTQGVVEVQWNNAQGDGLSSLVAVTGNASATFTGTASPMIEFFTLPTGLSSADLVNVLRPHLSWMNQWKSEYETITSSATYRKKLDRGSIYTKIGHRFIVNGALNSLIPSNFRILIKGTESPLSIDRDLQLYMQKRNYGFDLPEGIFMHDFDRSYGIEEFGDMRDYLDSRQVTQLESEVAYNSGTTFTQNSFVYTITQKLTPVNM